MIFQMVFENICAISFPLWKYTAMISGTMVESEPLQYLGDKDSQIQGITKYKHMKQLFSKYICANFVFRSSWKTVLHFVTWLYLKRE